MQPLGIKLAGHFSKKSKLKSLDFTHIYHVLNFYVLNFKIERGVSV